MMCWRVPCHEIKELLKGLSSEGILTLDDLKVAVHSFPFQGADSADKPSSFFVNHLSSADHGLKLSGDE